MDNRFALVDFEGDRVVTMFDGQTVRVAMRQVCDALGLDWSAQRRKIMADPVLSKGVAVMTTPFDRHGQEMVTLPLEMMHGWLFTVDISRVKEAATKSKVIAYQQESYGVLHDYWVKGSAVNPRMTQPAIAPVGDVIKLLEAFRKATNSAELALLHQMLAQACESRGLEAPALAALAPVAKDDEDADLLLWRIGQELALRPGLNHHRQEELIAVRPKELAMYGIEVPLNMMRALKRHPRYAGQKPVNCKDGKSRHCWVFRR